MSTEGNTRKTPTDKMLAFAERIATRKNLELPQGAREDFDACRAFIDEHIRPTDKQVGLARALAKEQGVDIPDEALRDGYKLSRWIDEVKGQ